MKKLPIAFIPCKRFVKTRLLAFIEEKKVAALPGRVISVVSKFFPPVLRKRKKLRVFIVLRHQPVVEKHSLRLPLLSLMQKNISSGYTELKRLAEDTQQWHKKTTPYLSALPIIHPLFAVPHATNGITHLKFITTVIPTAATLVLTILFF